MTICLLKLILYICNADFAQSNLKILLQIGLIFLQFQTNNTSLVISTELSFCHKL